MPQLKTKNTKVSSFKFQVSGGSRLRVASNLKHETKKT
ncbi:hypothetical protein SAMN05444397_101582 [Flavobacterium aquidurense]|nr:hypothetical protein SAMN05444397_101582 [Flavobacterium aquidurense]